MHCSALGMLWVRGCSRDALGRIGSAPHRPGDAIGSGMRSVRAGCGSGAMRAAL